MSSSFTIMGLILSTILMSTANMSFVSALTSDITSTPSLTGTIASSPINSTTYTNVTTTNGTISITNPVPIPLPNTNTLINASSSVDGVTAYGNGSITTSTNGVSMSFYFDPNAPIHQGKTGGNPISITEYSYDLTGKQITGIWVELHDSNGKVLNEGYTPITFSATSGTQYVVYTSNWQNIIFDHWDNSSTNPYRTITPTQSITLTAYYSTGTTTTIPQPPTNLVASAISSSQINLSWSAPTNNGGSAITGYKIERSTDSGSTWSVISPNTGNTTTSYSDTGLATNTAYSYRVSAINAVGTSSPSNTATATTPSTIHAINQVQSGLVVSDSLTNETMTQQQLQTNSKYWVYGGDAIAEKAPYSFYRDTQGFHIGVQAPNNGIWAGFFAASPSHNAALWHAVITTPVRSVPTGNYENGLYVQTSNGQINYVTCVSLTNNQATDWALVSTTGNFNQATSFTVLWMDTSPNQSLTRDCSIITNGDNYLKLYMDNVLVYSSTSLKLQMPGPFNAYLEPETSYSGQMLTGTFTDYYVTTNENIKVINLPSNAARVDASDSSGSVLATSPVSGGTAMLNTGKYHLPLGITIKIYDSNNSLIVSGSTTAYCGDVYSFS